MKVYEVIYNEISDQEFIIPNVTEEWPILHQNLFILKNARNTAESFLVIRYRFDIRDKKFSTFIKKKKKATLPPVSELWLGQLCFMQVIHS